jgi:hypothetical protein
MGFFDDDQDQLHHCEQCNKDVPEDEMANDEVCKNCEHKSGSNASFFESDESNEDEQVVEAMEYEADPEDPDFIHGFDADEDDEFGLYEGDEVETDEMCSEEEELEESNNFSKFMDKILIHESRKARKEVINDTPSVRYNKRYSELAQNRIVIKK